MRIGELLGKTATDSQGARVGVVVDVRLVQDGPIIGGHRAALRLDGLLLSNKWLRLFGYEGGPGPDGPWLVKSLVKRWHGEIWYVPWSDVSEVRDQHVVLRVLADSLQTLQDLRRDEPVSPG